MENEDMAQVRQMVLEQMMEMRNVDANDEDKVRAMAVKTQTVTNCAKVYSDCCIAEANMLKSKVAASKMIAGEKRRNAKRLAGDVAS